MYKVSLSKQWICMASGWMSKRHNRYVESWTVFQHFHLELDYRRNCPGWASCRSVGIVSGCTWHTSSFTHLKLWTLTFEWTPGWKRTGASLVLSEAENKIMLGPYQAIREKLSLLLTGSKNSQICILVVPSSCFLWHTLYLNIPFNNTVHLHFTLNWRQEVKEYWRIY